MNSVIEAMLAKYNPKNNEERENASLFFVFSRVFVLLRRKILRFFKKIRQGRFFIRKITSPHGRR